ncbi:MAG TPA: hypothetical protein VJI73_04835 [Candidatus Paceibacterota bacterium]
MVDLAFQEWVTNGHFRKTIKDPSLLSVLKIAQDERLRNCRWPGRTHRFLPAEGSTWQKPRFILTTDKSDIAELVRF